MIQMISNPTTARLISFTATGKKWADKISSIALPLLDNGLMIPSTKTFARPRTLACSGTYISWLADE